MIKFYPSSLAEKKQTKQTILHSHNPQGLGFYNRANKRKLEDKQAHRVW